MIEYEINEGNKRIGIVKLMNNIPDNISSIITSPKNLMYDILYNKSLQTYIISVIVNNDDELYDIVNLYEKEDVFKTIDIIKSMNNIKHIKNNTKLDIIIPENYLKYFGKDKKNTNLVSLMFSKIEFVKNVIKETNDINLKNKLNNIIMSYNNYKNSPEYEFYLDKEKEKKVSEYISKLDSIIESLEDGTNYKYSVDFITPIRIN